MSGAERARSYRQRQKAGIVLLTVAVDEVAHVAALVEAGLLDANMADDQEAIERATEKLLAYFLENPKCP